MLHQWRQVQPETDQGFSASASINVALSAVPWHMDGDIIKKALLIWALMVCPPSVIFAWFYWHVAWDFYFSVLSLCARYLISFVSLSSRALHSARGPHPCASYQRPAEKSGPLRCLQRGGLQLPLLPQHLHWRRPRRCGAVLKTFCAAVLHHLEREFWCQVFYMWMLRHAGGPQTFTLLVFMWLQIAVRGRKRATSWSRSTAPPQSTSCPAAKSAPWCPSSHRIRTGRWEAAIAFGKSMQNRIRDQLFIIFLPHNSLCSAWRSWPWVAGTLHLETGRCTATSCTCTLWLWRSAMSASLPLHAASTSTSQSTCQPRICAHIKLHKPVIYTVVYAQRFGQSVLRRVTRNGPSPFKKWRYLAAVTPRLAHLKSPKNWNEG